MDVPVTFCVSRVDSQHGVLTTFHVLLTEYLTEVTEEEGFTWLGV